MAFLASLSARAWASIGLVLALSGFAGWGYFHILDIGVATCEARHIEADAAAEASAHKEYLAAVARGDKLAEELAATQRRLNDTTTEYLAYANGISGNCPAAVGVLSNAAATGAKLPKAPSKPADPAATSGTIPASDIAANIAENYGRANACIAQLNLLSDWHTQAVTGVSP